jgi:hypothetical protein
MHFDNSLIFKNTLLTITFPTIFCSLLAFPKVKYKPDRFKIALSSFFRLINPCMAFENIIKYDYGLKNFKTFITVPFDILKKYIEGGRAETFIMRRSLLSIDNFKREPRRS